MYCLTPFFFSFFLNEKKITHNSCNPGSAFGEKKKIGRELEGVTFSNGEIEGKYNFKKKKKNLLISMKIGYVFIGWNTSKMEHQRKKNACQISFKDKDLLT